MFARLGRFFIELNFFKRNVTDEYELRIQRWSTRLYIILLFIAMLILFVYTILQIDSIQITIDNPSLTTYTDLYEKYGNIKCPCTDIAITYRTFLTLSPTYHQVCSSDLVSDEWIQFLYDRRTTTFERVGDLRAIAFTHFQILQSLCNLSFNAINNSLETLYQSQLISDKLLNQDLFNAQVEADISIFQIITTSTFFRSLSFMRSFMPGNNLLNSLSTSYFLHVSFIDINSPYSVTLLYYIYGDSASETCNCINDIKCHQRGAFYNLNSSDINNQLNVTKVYVRTYIDGWKVGCWPLESLLSSTLQSFYNQIMFNTIVYNFNSSILINHFQALNVSIKSHFSPNDTIEFLVKQLFIEDWSKSFKYSSYFSQCRPKLCEYVINNRPKLIYIITSLLGFYGGLSTVLHFIIPYITRFLLKKPKQQSIVKTNEVTNANKSFYQWFEYICHRCININLYRSSLRITSNDIKQQIWSTRIYIGFLLFALIILTLYSSINMKTQIIQKDNPSLDVVQELEKTGYSLTCPCQDLSVNYKYLVELKPIYHQICSSVFVTSEWIEYLKNIMEFYGYITYNDFCFTGTFLFRLLSSLCLLSNETINNAILQFGQTQLITNELLQIDSFTNQINSAIEQFQFTLPNNFLRLNQLLRNITFINQFLTAQFTNFLITYYEDHESAMIKPILRINGLNSLASDGSYRCSCAFDTICKSNTFITQYNQTNIGNTNPYIVPNFYVKCFPIESLLASTLECFYDNNRCFDIINNISQNVISKNWTRLNFSLFSHFPINVTIEKLVENIFIESWSTTISYSSYFNKCQPIYCTYIMVQRRSLLEIITVITGLIGGLSKILKILSPYLISIVFNLIRRYRQTYLPRNINTNQKEHISVRNRAMKFGMDIWIKIKTLNFFEDEENPSLNENEIYIKQQSTRLYLILLIFIIIILMTYTSFIYRNKQITENISSSYYNYIKFQDKHKDISINCPCTKLSTIRSTFYDIKPIFHDICSSDFISYRWTYSLFTIYRNLVRLPINAFTFRGTAYRYFQSLAILCNLTKQAVADAQNLFLTTYVVSDQMLNPTIFYLSTNSTFKDFQLTLSNDFIHNLNMFRDLSQGNSLVSVYSTNWNLFLFNSTLDKKLYMTSQMYNGCDCAISSKCIQYSIPYFPGYY
ncbi:unnamed protein product, partial [Adineta ricciae]